MLEELTRQWNTLGVKGRFALSAAVIASIGILALVVLWSKRPDYKPLMSGLKQADAANVTRKLKDLKVPYEISDDGETILVPASQLYQTRMDIAGSGVTEGHAGGFELFDKTRFQTSPLSEKVTYMRALQGELEQTIATLQEVDTVRVHLVLPQREILVDDSKSTTASIVLKLKPGAVVTPNEVRAIQALVAAAVPNLLKENITIMDTKGVLLSSGDEGPDGSAGASTMSDLTRQEEKKLQKRTQEMLDQILGAGMAVVRVSVELQNEQRVVESQEYKPLDAQKNTGVLRSRQQTDESYKGTGKPVGPATATGAKAVTQINGQSTNSDYKNLRNTENYEISNVKERAVIAPGRLKRISASVALSQDLKLTRPGIDDITDLVKESIGFDASRKDEVKVALVKFRGPGADNTVTSAPDRKWLEWARLAAPVLAVLAFWIIAGRMTRPAKPTGAGADLALGPGAGLAPGLPGGMGMGGYDPMQPGTGPMGGFPGDMSGGLSGTVPLPDMSVVDGFGPSKEESNILSSQVRKLALDDPRAIAAVLEKWIAKDQERDETEKKG